MSLKYLNQTELFRAPQDQIQWGILFLSRELRNFSEQKRERCLQEVWEWGAPTGGPAVPADDPGLSGVLQTERADLSSSSNLVLE